LIIRGSFLSQQNPEFGIARACMHNCAHSARMKEDPGRCPKSTYPLNF
jgi:hypothetical protein